MELYLHLAEREPIRQSYFRDWFYFLKEKDLYLKQYAWGRLHTDEVYKVSLQDRDYQLLRALFLKPEYAFDLDLKQEEESNGSLYHHYHLLLKRDQRILRQRVGATQSTFYSEHTHLPSLIQLLRTIIGKKYLEIGQVKATGVDFSLKLHIHESFGRSKASTRTYELSDQTIKKSTWDRGTTTSTSQEKWKVNRLQWNRLHQVFKSEYLHIAQMPELNMPYPNSWNSAFHCQISYLDTAQSFEKEIKGMRNQLHRQLGFIALQVLEKQINSLTHQVESPLLTINN